MTDISTTNHLPNAGLLRRLAAMTYDTLLAMAVSMGYGAVALFIKVVLLGEQLAEGEKAQLGPVTLVGLIVVITLFFCIFWRRGGQTLGMRAWRLKLVDGNNGIASWPQCLERCMLAPFFLAAGGIGYLWCLFDKEGQCLHDRITGTRVVVIPKS